MRDAIISICCSMEGCLLLILSFFDIVFGSAQISLTSQIKPGIAINSSFCPKGFYGYKCYKKCKASCASCDNHGTCSECSRLGVKLPDCTEACDKTRFGPSCKHRCDPECLNKECEPKTGFCQACRDAGFSLPTCTLPCLPGTYGMHCQGRCPAPCKDSCDRLSGICTACDVGNGPHCTVNCALGKHQEACGLHCPAKCVGWCNTTDRRCSMCTPGFKAPHCREYCEQGSYGSQCQQKCSFRCLDERCDPITGECMGCIDGYVGKRCNGKCISGLFGANCLLHCPETCADKLCRAETGTCERCRPGYVGLHCERLCEGGRYGNNCSLDCPPKCRWPCDPVTGDCQDCVAGYQGYRCNSTCDAGTYGLNCNRTCPIGCLKETCHHANGHCTECKEFFYGLKCDKFVPRKVRPFEVVVYSVLSLLTPIVLLGVVMTCYKHRSTTENKAIIEAMMQSVDPHRLSLQQRKELRSRISKSEIQVVTRDSDATIPNIRSLFTEGHHTIGVSSAAGNSISTIQCDNTFGTKMPTPLPRRLAPSNEGAGCNETVASKSETESTKSLSVSPPLAAQIFGQSSQPVVSSNNKPLISVPSSSSWCANFQWQKFDHNITSAKTLAHKSNELVSTFVKDSSNKGVLSQPDETDTENCGSVYLTTNSYVRDESQHYGPHTSGSQINTKPKRTIPEQNSESRNSIDHCHKINDRPSLKQTTSSIEARGVGTFTYPIRGQPHTVRCPVKPAVRALEPDTVTRTSTQIQALDPEMRPSETRDSVAESTVFYNGPTESGRITKTTGSLGCGISQDFALPSPNPPNKYSYLHQVEVAMDSQEQLQITHKTKRTATNNQTCTRSPPEPKLPSPQRTQSHPQRTVSLPQGTQSSPKRKMSSPRRALSSAQNTLTSLYHAPLASQGPPSSELQTVPSPQSLVEVSSQVSTMPRNASTSQRPVSCQQTKISSPVRQSSTSKAQVNAVQSNFFSCADDHSKRHHTESSSQPTPMPVDQHAIIQPEPEQDYPTSERHGLAITSITTEDGSRARPSRRHQHDELPRETEASRKTKRQQSTSPGLVRCATTRRQVSPEFRADQRLAPLPTPPTQGRAILRPVRKLSRHSSSSATDSTSQ